MPPAFRRTLIYARVFQYLLKDKTYLFLQDFVYIFTCYMLILRQELIHPVRMLFKLRIGTDIASGKDRLRQIGKLLFQSDGAPPDP